jgi:hypothetical protein
MWSDFYKYPLAPSLSVNVSGLTPGINYQATVTAYEPFGKASARSISTKFSTRRGESDFTVSTLQTDVLDKPFIEDGLVDHSSEAYAFTETVNPQMEISNNAPDYDELSFSRTGNSYNKTMFTSQNCNMLADAFTYKTMFKVNDDVHSRYYVNFGSINSDELSISVDRRLLEARYLSQGEHVTLSKSIKADTYYHLAVTGDDPRMVLCVNDAAVAPASTLAILKKSVANEVNNEFTDEVIRNYESDDLLNDTDLLIRRRSHTDKLNEAYRNVEVFYAEPFPLVLNTQIPLKAKTGEFVEIGATVFDTSVTPIVMDTLVTGPNGFTARGSFLPPTTGQYEVVITARGVDGFVRELFVTVTVNDTF